MTAVPLPDVPCVRANLKYVQSDGLEGGNRFYFSYPGSAPTGAQCVGAATTIFDEWTINLAPLVNDDWTLVEVDVLDIATDSGLSGQFVGSSEGSSGGVALPAQCATNVEFDIARRYRGGKPRMYLPPGATAFLQNPSTYTADYLADVNAGVAAFFAGIGSTVSVWGVGLPHVNLSYYKGFTNITTSSGRERAIPTYRATGLTDAVAGYSAKAVVGSQKRRRTATTA